MNTQSLTKTREVIDLPAAVPDMISRSQYSAEPQTGSLLDYWHLISVRKLKLAAFAGIGIGIGIGFALLQSPMYRATTSIEVQDAKDDNVAAKILNPQPDSTVTDPLTDIQTQIKIIQSRSLLDRALDKAQISSLRDLDGKPARGASWSKVFPMIPADGNHDSLVENVAKNLKVSVVSQTRVVEVSYDAPDPAVAAKLANVITSEYIEQNLEARLQLNRKTSDWLVGQLDEARGKLRQSEDALQGYARQEGLIYTGDKQNISEDKLREVQAEWSKAQADRVDKQSRFEIASGATPESIPEVLNDGNLRAMENNLVDLRKQEAQMAVTFKPDYTQAKKLRAEIQSLESDIDSKRTLIVTRLNNELQESKRREQLLGQAYSVQTRRVSSDSEKSIQYDMLKHEVDTNRQIYQVMLQRVKESSIASALKATNVRVIDPAKAPRKPFKPNLPMNAAAGFLFGLMLGITGIVIRSKSDGTVKEPGDAGMLLGIPELGVIPAAEGGLTSGWSSHGLFARKREPQGQGAILISASNRSSIVADSFRAVLASILFAAARQRQRVLVITSASPGEGKTTTASNLAVTLANMGRKVLLIDGDIRSPRMHSIFGLKNSQGLTTALANIAIDDVHSDTFIQETAVPNLQVLTSGPAIQAGADLLFSTLMPALIARYKGEYEMVLIDTPPMLVMPDARALGRVADAVVLIAKAGQTTRSAIQAAYGRFAEDRTSVLGVVLNNWNAKMSAHNYYAAYQEPTPEGALVRVTPVRA